MVKPSALKTTAPTLSRAPHGLNSPPFPTHTVAHVWPWSREGRQLAWVYRTNQDCSQGPATRPSSSPHSQGSRPAHQKKRKEKKIKERKVKKKSTHNIQWYQLYRLYARISACRKHWIESESFPSTPICGGTCCQSHSDEPSWLWTVPEWTDLQTKLNHTLHTAQPLISQEFISVSHGYLAVSTQARFSSKNNILRGVCLRLYALHACRNPRRLE